MSKLTVNQLMNKFARESDNTNTNTNTITESATFYTPNTNSIRTGTMHPLYEIVQAAVVTEKVIRERRGA